MKKILILGKIDSAGLSLLKKRKDFQIVQLLEKKAEEKKLIEKHLKDSDALLVRTQEINPVWLEKAKNLKIISRHGVGCDNLPLETIKKKNISLKFIGDVNSISVAEHTIALMLACAKKVLEYSAAAKNENWNIRDSGQSTELNGKNLLLIGCGKVGSQILKKLKYFGMHYFVYDPYLSQKQVEKFKAKKVGKLDANIFRKTDFVLLCCPKTKETTGVIKAEQISAMKKTAILINTARGGLIDEEALFLALKERKIASAGLDVLATEPLPQKNKLWKLNNLIITPHSASKTKESIARTSIKAVENILDFFV